MIGKPEVYRRRAFSSVYVDISNISWKYEQNNDSIQTGHLPNYVSFSFLLSFFSSSSSSL
jgi:hypothetical protein